VRFCRARADKRLHCLELGLTHFVDDRADVHAAIRGVVRFQYFFGDLDLQQPFESIRPALNQVGTQLTVQAREWYLAEVIRIAMADGPLTEGERHAALAIGVDLGMTQAQVTGVVAMTEQSAGRD